MYGSPSGFKKFGVKNILDLILNKLIFSKYLAKICMRTAYIGELLRRQVVTSASCYGRRVDVGELTFRRVDVGESTSASRRRRDVRVRLTGSSLLGPYVLTT